MDTNRATASNVADIFEMYLRELAISEFPCGKGKWRNDLKWESDLLESKSDISAELFTVERLLELSYEKPFHKEIIWSADAKTILNEAIRYPQKVRLDNIHRKFKSLRMVNKSITSIDEYITKFENLEELVLSANSIHSLNSKILPRSLRVLELSGNKLYENIDSLCVAPPRLQHIGLSHNNISSISNFIQPRRWESLLSLDLSYNNLENLFYISDLLKDLPKLRNLHLIGNPLYLFIGYRGYIVDSFQSLAFLDEVNISAHERHLYKGMSRLKELLTSDFCVVKVKLDYLKGLIKHEEVEQTEDLRPTFIRYHVEFTFMKESFIFNADDLNSGEVKDEVKDESCVISNDDELSVEDNSTTSDPKSSHKIVKSNDFSFSDEEKDLIFNKNIVCNDAKQLIIFFSNILEVRIVRNVITMTDEPPVENEPLLSVNETDPPDKMGKMDKMRPKLHKRDSVASGPKQKLTKPRKLKVNVGDLYEVSRTSEICAKVDVDCRSILNGSLAIKKDCTFVLLDVNETEQETDVVINNVQSDRVKKKHRRSSVKQQQETTSSTKNTISGGKANNKGELKFEESNMEGEFEQCITESPSLLFHMKVIHWNSANEGFDWIEKHGTRCC